MASIQQQRSAELSGMDKSALRAALQDTLAKYSREIEDIAREFAIHCPKPEERMCPQPNEKNPAKHILVCTDRACLIDQLTLWLAQLTRWAQNEKWSGNLSNTRDLASETKPITEKDYREIILYVETTVHRIIGNVRDQVAQLARERRPSSGFLTAAQTFITTNWIALLIALVIVILVLVLIIVSSISRTKKTNFETPEVQVLSRIRALN